MATFAVIACLSGFAGLGRASELIGRNASGAGLQVDAHGVALVTFHTGGRLQHVLAWGAIDARAPDEGRPQVAFRLSYAANYGAVVRRLEQRHAAPRALAAVRPRARQRAFTDGCRPYDGPHLTGLLAACTAPDGSYWALQEWQRELPDYGLAPTPQQAAEELRLSHWRGPLAVLAVQTDWSWHRFDHLFGTFTYRGRPVFGFGSTSGGNPLDSYGRNVYIDTYDSAYGPGWRRENSALTHTHTGVFCYSFNPHGSRPAGKGSRYRITVIGPGVTPDVRWEGDAPGPYSRAADRAANARIAALGDRLCRPN